MTIANQIISFKLSGINYVGTSTQLNYTAGVIAGTALESKALVLDINKSASGINSFSVVNLIASSGITGTIATGTQPNIVQVGTLNGLNVNGILNVQQHNGTSTGLQLGGTLINSTAVELNYLAGITVGSATGNKALVVNSSRNLSNINAFSCASINISNGLTINNVNVLATANELNYLNTPQGVGENSKALILDSSKNITGINTIGVNTLNSNNLSGTIITALQPNITQIGTLTSLTLSGSASGIINLSMSGNLSGVNNLSATNISGTISTASQPNITQLGTILNLNVSGRTTTANATIDSLTLGSTQITATGAEINNLAGATAGTASNGKALVVNSTRDIININSLTANSLVSTSLTGLLQTSTQTNITQIGILNNLEVGGNSHIRFVNNSANFSSYEQWTNNLTTPISSRLEMNNENVRFGTTSNHTLRFITNNLVSMSIENTGNVNIGSQTATSFRLNVAGSANFSSINIGGNAINASSSEINNLSGATAGSAVNGKVIVVDNNRSVDNLGTVSASNLTATNITGTLATASQPNITQLGELSSLTINSSGVGLIVRNTTANSASVLRFNNDIRNVEFGLRGSTSPTTPNCLYIIDSVSTRLLMDSSGNFTLGGTVSTNNRLNVIGNLNTSTLSINGVSIVSSSEEINYLSGVTLGSASSGKVLVVDSNRDIGNIRNITATNISGLLTTASQTNITQVGTLNGLTINGNISGITNLNMTGNLSGASVISANTLIGTVSTASQPNITQLGVLNNIISNGNVKVGTTASSAIDMIHVEGNNSTGLGIQIENRNTTSNSTSYVKFTGFNSSNDDYDMARISCGYVPATANFGYGYLSFSTRDNSNSLTASERMRITESGNVGVGKTNPAFLLDVAGTINCDSLRMNTATISFTDLIKLNSITNGNASADKALILDSSRNIGNINILTATTLAGTLSTASQPNITQLGTLSSLSVSGAITGTLSTASQPNITQLGNLTELRTNGNIICFSTTASTSTSTGSIISNGGIGIQGNLNMSGTANITGSANIAGVTAITNNTNSTATNNGAFIVAGGVGIGNTLRVAGSIVGSSTVTGSSFSTTGSVTASGNITSSASITASSNITSNNGYVYASSDVISDGTTQSNNLKVPRNNGTLIRGMYLGAWTIDASSAATVWTVFHNFNLPNPNSSHVYFTVYGGGDVSDQFQFRVVTRSANSFNVRVSRCDNGANAGWGASFLVGYMVMSL